MAPKIFSIAMVVDYSFELISTVHWVPQFFMRNKSILGGVSYVRPFIFVKYFSVLLDAENFQSCSCHFFFFLKTWLFFSQISTSVWFFQYMSRFLNILFLETGSNFVRSLSTFYDKYHFLWLTNDVRWPWYNY